MCAGGSSLGELSVNNSESRGYLQTTHPPATSEKEGGSR